MIIKKIKKEIKILNILAIIFVIIGIIGLFSMAASCQIINGSAAYRFPITSGGIEFVPDTSQFTFNLTARSVAGWIDVTGHPHTAVRSGTDGFVTVSTRSTTYWSNIAGATAVQSGGEETANPSYVFPQNVVLDYFFSFQTSCSSGNEQIEVSGLTALGYYTIQLLPSRNNSNVPDATRQVIYVIRHNGTRTTLAAIDCKQNTSNYAQMINVQADATGKFWIGSYGNAENVNSNYGYFNGLRIISQSGIQ